MLVHRCDANASEVHTYQRKRKHSEKPPGEAQHSGRSGSAGGVFRSDSWSLLYKTKALNARAHSKKTKTWMAENSFDKGDFIKIIDKFVVPPGSKDNCINHIIWDCGESNHHERNYCRNSRFG